MRDGLINDIKQILSTEPMSVVDITSKLNETRPDISEYQVRNALIKSGPSVTKLKGDITRYIIS